MTILTIENIIFLILLSYLLYLLKFKRNKIFDVLILYFMSSNLFSILIFNTGSLYRYRFPLIFLFIFTTYWLQLKKYDKNKKIIK